MVIGIKDTLKLIGIIIMMMCAGFVCTLFINYNIDLSKISDQIEPGQMQMLYDAQQMSGKVVIGACGGCLLATSLVMLIFYIKFYIDGHKSELGILKALGYSNIKLAKDFYKFGASVLAGTLVGFLGAHLMMGKYYDTQLDGGMLPMFEPSFNWPVLMIVVIIPTIAFSIISILYAYKKLK